MAQAIQKLQKQKLKDLFNYKEFKRTKHSHIMYEEFINQILGYNPHADKELIKKAYLFAHNLHKGQKRVSGETYFTHPLEVTLILTKLRADSASICAALLHDCVEDCDVTLNDIKEVFGDEIAHLVDGVTKFKGIRFSSKEEYTAENIRKVLIASTKDIRVILIKLADRLHNMRTLHHFPKVKQERIAKETLEIYAPIAHKLGVHFIKGELEDLCLKVFDSTAYKMIRLKVSEKRKKREKQTKELIALLKGKLTERKIQSFITGRAKYFSSIYYKMKKEKKDFEDISDLIALRIVVKTIPECYAVLGMVHETWKPQPKRFKDYIATPKGNGYQSLHTSVVAKGKILEIQIRTADMHNIAEEGLAAHWRYKGTERDKKFERKLSWLKQLLEWKQESKTAREFVETLKIDLFQDEIVTFTPKGDPISLPESSCPVDFAYAVHTNLGNQCVKAEVNGHTVGLDHSLSSGDIVKIGTKKNAKPMRNWLSFIKTSKARSKIRSLLHIKVKVDRKAKKFTPKFLLPKIELPKEIKPGNVKFSKCCEPLYGDPILAFLTKDKKVTIHKKECDNIYTLDQSKLVRLAWKEEKNKNIRKLKVIVRDRVGLLADIMSLVAGAKINVLSINTRNKKDKVALTFKMKITSKPQYEDIVKKIRLVNRVVDVKKYDQEGNVLN